MRLITMDFSQIKQIKPIYLIISSAVLVLVILILVFGLIETGTINSASITFWGFEDEEVYRDLFLSIGAKYPLTINYVRKSPENYENELLNAMASGNGPDVFPIHNTWLGRYFDKLSPAPTELIPLKQYYDTFVDAATQDFVADGYIWAAPLYVDSLALYWNKDLFNTAGIPEPPKTWDEFLVDVEKITKRDESGNILLSGAAMGTGLNIANANDILSLLMLQTGTKMVDENKTRATFNQGIVVEGREYKPGAAALEFYTDFANPQKKVYCWNIKMPGSKESFLQSKTAMIFDYSSAASEILKKSPYLNFSIAPAPQIKETSVAVNYADYWANAVWSGSKAKKEAWQFILYLTEQENSKTYAEKSLKPVSRRDLISWQKNEQYLGAFATSALSARSWHQIDNIAIAKIFQQMIEAVVTGQATINEAVERGAGQVNILMEEKAKSGAPVNVPSIFE